MAPYPLRIWPSAARRGQFEQYAPQVVTTPRQASRAQLFHPVRYPSPSIRIKQPPEFNPIPVGQHTLNDKLGMTFRIKVI